MKEDFINRLIETIDRASSMSAELTRTCKLNMDVYDKHLVSLEESRDRAEKEAAESIRSHHSARNCICCVTNTRVSLQKPWKVTANSRNLIHDLPNSSEARDPRSTSITNHFVTPASLLSESIFVTLCFIVNYSLI